MTGEWALTIGVGWLVLVAALLLAWAVHRRPTRAIRLAEDLAAEQDPVR